MSLLPLGLLSQGGSSAPVAFELISSQVLGSNATSVTFSSIPSTYKHLQVRVVAKSNSSSTGIDMTFNGATTGYAWHNLYANGSSALVEQGAPSVSFIKIRNGMSESSTANAFAGSITDILDYADTNKNKTSRSLSGARDTNSGVNMSSGLFVNTSAISSLTLTADSGNSFVSNSRFSLYGVKGIV
jgi:hypothetical protein